MVITFFASAAQETTTYAYAFWLVITAVVSITGAAFVAGKRTQRTDSDISMIKRDLAEIKGMFVLKLKEPKDG